MEILSRGEFQRPKFLKSHDGSHRHQCFFPRIIQGLFNGNAAIFKNLFPSESHVKLVQVGGAKDRTLKITLETRLLRLLGTSHNNNLTSASSKSTF